jgi:Ras-related protein Rab-23
MCVLVFSTVDSKSFEAIESWKAKVEDECESNVLTVLVQNKIDLLDEAAYSHEEVEELVHKLNVKLFRTSVKENFNVDPIFDYLAKTFLSQRKQTIKEINSNGNNLIANAFRSVDTNNEIEVNKSTPNGPSSSLTNNAGQTSFRIKPNKQRTNKRFRFCLLL